MYKPYYQDKWVTIYHGDCREILPSLGKLAVDLVLTDPPYGIEYHSGYYKYGNPFTEIKGDTSYPVSFIPVFRHLASKAVLLFARWEVLRYAPEPKSVIVWVKNNWTAGDLNHAYGRQWECILFYTCGNHRFSYRPSDVITCDRIIPTRHPTEKPTELIDKLILPNTNVNDLIVDPFVGVGTTCYCAKKLQRRSIGIDTEERYCEMSAKRCSQGVFEFNEPLPQLPTVSSLVLPTIPTYP